MKKIAILLFITSSFVFAQNTYVPDDKFEQALIDLGYDTTLDDYVLTANISGVTGMLNVSNKQIADLTGIEAFTALTELNCQDNLLTSLDVSNNTALTYLHCSGNQLTSLDVSANTALLEFFCYDNQLTSLDVTATTALTLLRVHDNKLTSLDVNANTALTHLECYNNQLTSLDVTANTALTDLRVDHNELTSLDVSKNTALSVLHCFNNELTSLDVSKNTVLKELACSNNQLTSLDVSKNTALKEMDCSYNQLTSLDVSKNTALFSLWCKYNQLTSLDVSKNKALTAMSCGGNQLTSLDVSANTALTDITCSGNKLTTLDVSKNTVLSELAVQSNQLTSLDVSKNTTLTKLSFNENQLTSLDLSKNTALLKIEGWDNALTSLNMRNGVKNSLTTFVIHTNPSLTCIEVLDPAWATANWVSVSGGNIEIDAGVTFSVICGGTDLTTWHVATTGSDVSGSGTLASPLATIQTGINAATESDTVLVAAGTYKENIDFKGNNISVVGDNRETTIIDGNQSGSVVTIKNGEGSTAILKNFTITNSGGFSEGEWGGGVFVDNSKPTLESLIIDNNNVIGTSYQGGGGGLCVINSGMAYINNSVISNTSGEAALYANKGGDIIATNCLIVNNNNYAVRNGLFYEGVGGNDVELIHCTVVNNLGALDGAGPGWGTVTATNSIIYNNLDGDGNNQSYNPDNVDYYKITYSLVQGGHVGEGNIDADPLFCDTTSFTVYNTSPVIGSGKNGYKMGAGSIGCDAPPAFTWVTPSEYDTVKITKENLNTEYIVKWTTSKDVYNDSLRYHIVGTGGNLIESTSDTSNSPTYQELLEEWPAQFQMLSRMTYVYDVWATDGKDSTKITGEPRKLYVNRYEYLSIAAEGIPTEFTLHENYPNPFNPTTTLRFDLPEISDISLTIYNMLGQKVKTFNMQGTPAGYHSVTWDATNDFGEQVGAGVYLYQLQSKDFVKTRKMVLLK